MPYMYSEMQNKLSKTRDSPLESMGLIISSRCPCLWDDVIIPGPLAVGKSHTLLAMGKATPGLLRVGYWNLGLRGI